MSRGVQVHLKKNTNPLPPKKNMRDKLKEKTTKIKVPETKFCNWIAILSFPTPIHKSYTSKKTQF